MSSIRAGQNTFFLFTGDAAIFFVSLWLALTVRQLAIPQATFYIEHLYPFTILFGIWAILFLIAGLYDEELLTIKRSIGDILVVTQLSGAAIAITLFYLVPFFNVTPKTNLALFLVIFSLLVWLWRRYFFYTLRPPTKEVLLVGKQEQLTSIFDKKNFYGFSTKENLSWQELSRVKKYSTDILVLMNYADPEFTTHSKKIHDLIFNNYKIADTQKIKERLFGKIDLTNVSHQWFIRKIEHPNRFFLFTKRLIDSLCGIILLLILSVLLPFVALWTLFEEKKLDLFFIHTRTGQLGKSFITYKLRTMSVKDGKSWNGDNHKKITKIGRVLRAFRLDELPQGINLIRGDISLVGPRAIFESEQESMQEIVPFYHLRLFVKPGITGWAQIKQKHAPMNDTEAEERLMYDLYYIQHQSLLFDIVIILRTIKTIILKLGMR